MTYAILSFTKDVVWFQVSMGNTISVEEVEGRGHLRDDLTRLSLSEPLFLLNVCQEMTSEHSVKDKTKLIFFLEEFNEIQNIPEV